MQSFKSFSKHIFKAPLQGDYDRRVIDELSPFLSSIVSSLLSTDPESRPTAEEMLLRLNEEENKVGGSQYQVEKDRDASDFESLNKRDNYGKYGTVTSQDQSSSVSMSMI